MSSFRLIQFFAAEDVEGNRSLYVQSIPEYAYTRFFLTDDDRRV